MKKTITSSLIIIIAFLLYRYSKFFWAYIVFGKEQWLAMDMVYSSSLMLLTGLVIAFGCSKLLYGNFLPQNFGLKEDFLKSLATAFILSLPMFLGYACCFGWNEESDLKLVYRDLVLAGFGEEFIYRGFLFGFLFYYAKWGFIPANLLPSLFFGLGHLYQANDPMGSLFVFLFTALGSAGFAWFYYAWNSLWTIIFLHGFMDLAWDLFNVDTNVVGNTTVNIFRFTTLILTIIWSIKVSEKEGRGGAELLKKCGLTKEFDIIKNTKMKKIYCLLFLFWTGTILAQQQEKYNRLRVFLDGRPAQELMQLGITCDHGEHRHSVHFESDFSETDQRLLDNAGFRYEVLISDVVRYYEQQNTPIDLRNTTCGASSATTDYPQPSNFVLGSMGGYLTYQQMLDNLDSMASKYPNLITSRAVIDSNNLTHENRPLYWVKISDNPNIDEPEPEALYDALHHAREPLGLSQLIYYMWYLLENYSTNPEIQYIVDNTELYFVPCINPDGYIYNQNTNPNGGGMWRKNRRNNGGSYGVDLNRNYGYAFAFDNIGSSGTPTSDTYRGPSAFSEPESQNIRDFCNAHNFLFSLNYHTYGGQLIYPWAYNDQLTPDSSEYRTYAAIMTRENNYIYGTNMETIGYSTNGDADDWFYGEQTTKGKILTMTPEASTGGFWPAASTIVPQSQGTMWQNLAMAHFMLIYGEVKDQSLAIVNQLNVQADFEVSRYGMLTGDLTVGVVPLSSNIQSVGADKVFSLAQFASVSDAIAIQLNPTIANGETFRYILTISNGFYTKGDTIERVYGAYTVALNDNGNNMTNWSNQGTNSSWDFTTATYYSPSACLTDSKNGSYANNKTSEIFLNQTLNLANVTDASLEFWAKWDIEADYDYVQVMASNNGGPYQALCGLYTDIGTNNQDANEPLYDGTQTSWVAERMSLNDFLGATNVSIKIRLVSDIWVNADGFYFDDFKVNVLTPNVSSVNHLNDATLIGQNQPNPAAIKVFIPLEIPTTSPQLSLEVCNVLGQKMYATLVDNATNGVEITLDNWEEGIYFYQLVGDDYQSVVYKMVVAK